MANILYHNPRCSKSRTALELLRINEIPFKTVCYLDNPPTEEEIRKMVALLKGSPADLVRSEDLALAELGLGTLDLQDREAVVSILVSNPRFMQRPLFMTESSVVIGRPPERILEAV